MVRLGMLGFVVGAAALHLLAAVPGNMGGACIAALLAAGLVLGWRIRWPARRSWRRGGQTVALVMAAAGIGFATTGWRAEQRLTDALDVAHENLVTRLVIDVVGLPTGDAHAQRFVARVVTSPVAGVPRDLLVNWYAAPHAPAGEAPAMAPGTLVRPGERYSAALVLRRPHGAMNPHAFDAEAWLFERGLRAQATVRGAPVLLEDAPWRDLGIAVQRLRHVLRESLRPHLEGTRWGPLVLALALGDQAGVQAADWELFNRSGITHLVSISGMHVTLLSSLVAGVVVWLWPRLRWRRVSLAERMPAQVPAAMVAVLVALGYSLVAGWGVPARRTFYMLATVAITVTLRLPLSPSRVLVLALFAVTLADPWAPLSPGFWLSFGAVAVLLWASDGRWRAAPRWRWVGTLREATRLQLIMSVALVPALALQFHSVSLVSPLANALAIPVVSLVATPLSLAGMLLAPVTSLGGSVARAAEAVLGWLMVPVSSLADRPEAAIFTAAPSWPWVVLAAIGVAYALLPAGAPRRAWGWLTLAPLLLLSPTRPLTGEWRLTALDIGQGAAIVIETARHTVVVDTGPPLGPGNDAGERTVWPYLRARGVRHLDDLIVSHADADHIGGLSSLLKRLPVTRLRMPGQGEGDGGWAPCAAGQGWWLDGVAFRFLHPLVPGRNAAASAERNANSCVLLVQGLHHAALLPGDIGRAQEMAMAQRTDVGADVVLMAHHGSDSSSAPAFIDAVGAQHAIAQAGYLSRFGHPRAAVLARWTAASAQTHRTDQHGAVIAESRAKGLTVRRQRETAARYWHRRDP